MIREYRYGDQRMLDCNLRAKYYLTTYRLEYKGGGRPYNGAKADEGGSQKMMKGIIEEVEDGATSRRRGKSALACYISKQVSEGWSEESPTRYQDHRRIRRLLADDSNPFSALSTPNSWSSTANKPSNLASV